MPDNVPITAGTGTNIATDDCGAGGHAQIIKQAISTDGAITLIPADATNGLDVDVTRVSGGATAHDGASPGNPLLIGGFAKAAAPTDVSADGDAVNAWFLKNGAQVTSRQGDTLPGATALFNGATANGSSGSLDVRGFASVLVQNVNTAGATVSIEVSPDSFGWYAMPIAQIYPNQVANIGYVPNALVGTNASGFYRVSTSGWRYLRAVISNYSSGSISVSAWPTNDPVAPMQTAKLGDYYPAAQPLQTAATATGNGTSMDVRGYAQALLVTTSASWTATITVEASVDDTNWVALDMTQLVQAAPAIVSNMLNNGQTTLYRVLLNSYKSLRARISGYTSGSVTISGYLSNTPSDFVNVAVIGSVGVTATAGTTDVVASGNITTQNLNPTTGAATTGSTVAFTNNTIQGRSTVGIQITGSWTGNLTAQGTTTGSTWVDLALVKTQGDIMSVIPGGFPGLFSCDIAGLIAFRITALGSVTGTAVVTLRGGAGFSPASIGVVGRISNPITLNNGQGYPVGNEDVASTNNDAGMKMLAVRKATPANTSDADGDYEFLQLSNGRLWVSGDGNTLSTANSSAAALGAAGVFTGTAEDITDYATISIYVFANVASATDGLSIQQSSDGTNWDFSDVYTVAAGTGKAFSVQAAARYFRVVYTNGGGAQASFRLQTILHRHTPRGSSQRPADARTNETDMEEVLAYQAVFNGTTWDRARGSIANGLAVDVTRLPGVAGDIAHDGVDSGNPVKVGHRAIAHGTNPTAVAAADRTDSLANRHGVPFVIGGHPNIQTVRLNITTAVTDTAVVTVATGLKIVVTAFMFTLDNASTVFPKVTLGFGVTTTPTTTGVIGAHGGVPGGGGFGRGDGSGIIGVGADNEDLRVTTVGAATGNGMDLVVTYYTVES